MNERETARVRAVIVKTPGTCFGKARIEGTRISVVDVMEMAKCYTDHQLVSEIWTHLTIEQIRAAKRYARRHKEEILASVECGPDRFRGGCRLMACHPHPPQAECHMP